MKVPVPNARLGDRRLRQPAHVGGVAVQNGDFQAIS
jgi:hypothetical protein